MAACMIDTDENRRAFEAASKALERRIKHKVRLISAPTPSASTSPEA